VFQVETHSPVVIEQKKDVSEKRRNAVINSDSHVKNFTDISIDPISSLSFLLFTSLMERKKWVSPVQ